ncbi:MAG: MobA/MobL family protein [Lachnospiraceae bacterium]|nr:MobA/MobL family protein [Lachnospiraceae bacterium]
MAIFHFTVKIIGRSKGRSVISASAYLNGDVMKNEETGEFSRYTIKKEVVFTNLSMCANAPPEWQTVPEENIKRFMNSTRYKRAEDKDMALRRFKTTFQKQRLWNEVLKVEKSSDAQLARSFEFSLPREWTRIQQIQFANFYIRRNFVEKGMCADWSIHDKGDGNPHVHLLVTMRPFNPDHTWGNKGIKDWAFVRDEQGNPVIDPSDPNWWQDKKNPDRCGIRIPLLDSNGNQKIDSRNRKQWKRVLTDATGWNNPKNCELWRKNWAIECNSHLPPEQHIDHRSFARQGKVELPTIHEGANARKIAEKFQAGEAEKPSWKAEENQQIHQQNAFLQVIMKNFQNAKQQFSIWKERFDEFRRRPGVDALSVGRNDKPERGTTEFHSRPVSGVGAEQPGTGSVQGRAVAIQTKSETNNRRIRTAEIAIPESGTIQRQLAEIPGLASRYQALVRPSGTAAGFNQEIEQSGSGTEAAKSEANNTNSQPQDSEMERIRREIEQRESVSARLEQETEQRKSISAKLEHEIEQRKSDSTEFEQEAEQRESISAKLEHETEQREPFLERVRRTIEHRKSEFTDLIAKIERRQTAILVNRSASSVHPNRATGQKRTSFLSRLDENNRIIAEREESKTQDQDRTPKRGRSR